MSNPDLNRRATPAPGADDDHVGADLLMLAAQAAVIQNAIDIRTAKGQPTDRLDALLLLLTRGVAELRRAIDAAMGGLEAAPARPGRSPGRRHAHAGDAP